MWSTLLSLIPSVISMFSSNSAEDDYQKKLSAIRNNQALSQSALQAKSLLAENATRGLAGYETMKSDIENRLPETIAENRDWLSSGEAVDFLVKSKAETDRQLRSLATANEQQKQNNMKMYADYLGTNMANREDFMRNNQADIDIAKAQLGYNQAATNSKQWGNLIGSVGNIADMDWEKLLALFSGGADPSASIPVGSTAFNQALLPTYSNQQPTF